MNQHKIPSIQSLHNEKQIKETSKVDLYNIVLNKIISKIVYTNRHTDKTYVIFEVPKILIGYPQYEMKSCILFIINKLSTNQYIIEFIEPFYLYIDWGSLSINGQNVAVSSNLKEQTKLLLKKFPGSKIEYVYEDSVAPKLGESSSKIKSKKKNNK